MSKFTQTCKGILLQTGQFLKKIWNKCYEAVKKVPEKLRKLMTKPAGATGVAEQTTIRTSGSAVMKKSSKLKIHRFGSERVYRLKGYTTVAKINRKRKSEHQQRLLRRVILTIVIVLLVIILFTLYNPIKNIDEWKRILGVNELTDILGGNTTAPTTSSTTIDPSATTMPSDTLPSS